MAYSSQKSLSERLFWKCYKVERTAVSIFNYPIHVLPSTRKSGLIGLALAVLLATIPNVVNGEEIMVRHRESRELAVISGVARQVIEAASISNTNELETREEEEDIIIEPETTTATLPQSSNRKPRYSKDINVTFYSSTVDQTDETPFITAMGTHVRHGIVAANFLPLGTFVKLPELYGDQMFVVEDRMDKRFHQRVDVWVETREEAIQKGIEYSTLEVY